MTIDGALELLRNAMLMVAQVAGPALLAALVVGLVVGIIQTATQVNEQSVTFTMKLIALSLAMVIGGPYILQLLVEYTRHSIASITEVVK